ncbi:MAG: hypothetical protein IJJ70_05520 [Treponema sp.]|nr:hypothetical protein [Treponema sp.]
MRLLTADTIIRVKQLLPLPRRRELTGDTRIRLSQIADLEGWVEDQKYEIGQISTKTGLLKTANGWVVPPSKTSWSVPRSLGAVAKVYTAKVDTAVSKGKSETYTLKEGSKVKDIELIAKGHGIKNVSRLMKKYKRPNGSTTNATDWTKRKGIGTVVGKDGKEKQAELHWYECQGMGKMEFKVKKWKEEK